MSASAFPASVGNREPLVSEVDLAEYREGLSHRLAGEWDEERWTAYRVRFGVYGQRQDGVQMVRIKVPGGILPTPWLKTLASVNREFCDAEAHVTTRQDIQIYGVPLARTGELLEKLYAGGLPTREACGNTPRNITSCPLSGSCPKEHVNAAQVATQLATAWIRHPLVQHMPRKMKFSVSGCDTDCAFAPIHDIGFIAVEKGGAKGFRVLAGGGLGAQPRVAVQVEDFVGEQDLPVVVEALVRLHQRYSDRVNRNAARLKFLVKRFGEAKFVDLYREELARLKGLPQRPWDALAWRTPSDAVVDRNPLGVLKDHDGTQSVAVYIPLGLIQSDQLDQLHDLAVAAGVTELRTTQTQNLVFLGVKADKLDALIAGVKAIGFDVPKSGDAVPHVVSCPGTTTCRIGITSSQGLARVVEAHGKNDPLAAQFSVHISGCPNSCGLHHVADIGLHGMSKKMGGKVAPHYQLHFGGDARTGQVGVTGPLVPARLADDAIGLLRTALVTGRKQGETVRAWAERLGKSGVSDILAPLEGKAEDGLFVDWGEDQEYSGPNTGAKSECAATFASEDLLADLADDSLISVDRHMMAGREAEAREWAAKAAMYAARLLVLKRGVPTSDDIGASQALDLLTSTVADLAAVTGAVAGFRSLQSGDMAQVREATAVLLDTVRAALQNAGQPVAAAAVDLAAILGAAE